MDRPAPGFLTGEELRGLHRGPRRLPIQLFPVYLGFVLIFGALHVVETSAHRTALWMAYPVAFVLVGWCQFVLVQALHEVAHRVIGRGRFAANVAAVSMAYPLALTLQFRGQHLRHHRHFGDAARDPDFAGYGRFPGSKLSLLGHLVHSASGLAALRDFLAKSRDVAGLHSQRTSQWAELAKLALVQALVLIVFSVTLGPSHYVFLWALPLLTVVKLCTAIRLLCEHGSRDKPYVWRSFDGGVVQRNLLGAFGLNYHAEHHRYPTIPYENLGRAFAIHQAKHVRRETEQASELYETYRGGHLGLLLDWFRELPLLSSPAESRAST